MGMTSEASEQWVPIEKKKRGKFKHAEEKRKPQFLHSVYDLFHEVEKINLRLNGQPEANFLSLQARKWQNRMTTVAIIVIRAKDGLIRFVTEYEEPEHVKNKKFGDLRIRKSPNYLITFTAKRRCKIKVRNKERSYSVR